MTRTTSNHTYYARNREACLARSKVYYYENRDEIKEQQREERRLEREELPEYYRWNCARKNARKKELKELRNKD